MGGAFFVYIPILNQSSIFVGNAARQGTQANAWACLERCNPALFLYFRRLEIYSSTAFLKGRAIVEIP